MNEFSSKEINSISLMTKAKIFQQQIINPNKLLEKIQELIKLENYPLAKLYLFIMKLSNKSKNFGIKINIMLYLSEIATKEKNENESIKLGHKVISWINNLDIKKYNNDVILILLQILVNSSEICEKNYILLSCWFLYVAKNLCMKRAIKSFSINEIIKTKFPLIIKKLNEEINDIKDDIIDKKNNIIRLGEEIKKYIKKKKNENIYFNLKK